MDVSVRYRGTLQDLSQVETFEDRIVELALEVDGYARIWRSAPKEKPDRVLRGVILNLAPGLGTVGLLVSPEGWLVPLDAVEAAEAGRMAARPWVACPARFATVEAHAMLVVLLETLRREFFPDLEIEDGGGYAGGHDLGALLRARGGPAPAEGPELLDRRVGRLAATVRRAIERPPEHAPVRFAADDEPDGDDDRYGTEAEWEAFYRQNQRRDARLMRALDEKSLQGDLKDGDFEEAMRNEGILDVPGIDDEDDGEDEAGDGPPAWADPPGVRDGAASDVDADGGAPWRESLAEGEAAEADDEDGDEPPSRIRHPLLRRASDLLLKVMKRPERAGAGWGNPLDPLLKGLMELSGGLAQVLGSEGEEEDDDGPFGHSLVQLKRALRGVAHARGAIAPALAAGLVDDAIARHAASELDTLEREIRVRAEALRDRLTDA
jgi:hypothetical protein